ncbi:MAG: hypothetical protein ACYTDX_10430, partial [Planctomycetota bacterium]
MSRPARWSRQHIAWIGCLALAACGALPRATVKPVDGQLLVQVEEAQSFRALAVTVYNDVQLARAVADVAGLPYEHGVEAGAVLNLPTKKALKEHVAGDKKADSLFDEGEREARRGEWGKAAAKYREALEVRPERADIRQGLGVALL